MNQKRSDLIKMNSISISLVILKVVLTHIAKNNTELIETYFSRGFYQGISSVLTNLSNLIPFSLGEVVLFCVLLYLVYRLVKLVIALFKKAFNEVLIFLSFVFLFIMVNSVYYDLAWGLNNYRQDIVHSMELTQEDITMDDMTQTYKVLINDANRLRAMLSEDIDGKQYGMTKKEVLANAYKGYEKMHDNYPFINDKKVIVKALTTSTFQSKSGYSGVYLYYVGEPNVNIMPPIYTIPFTACHEIAHQKGFAQEDVANYLSFLACRESEEVLIRYSGYYSAVIYVGNAIYRQDPKLYEALQKNISDDVKKDMKQDKQFWDAHVNEQSEAIMDQLNDAYLKSNNQPDGIVNYSKMVELVVRDYITKGGI